MLNSYCPDIYSTLCQKNPNSNIYIIADHHFYHQNIIDYTRTNFLSVEEMNEYIINCHNKIVKPNDIVIFLGDFCFKKAEIKSILALLNGHKYLVLGNHDSEEIKKNYPSLGFDGVYSSPVKLGNAYLSHEPLIKGTTGSIQFDLIAEEFKNASDCINYHGHIHDLDANIGTTYYNVTCEFLNYKPLLIGRTKSFLSFDTKNIFINSPYFSSCLIKLYEKHGISPSFLIKDYIYSYILSSLSEFQDSFYAQGSFGLFKKYGFISNFSDLDISALYDANKSKNLNIKDLKALVDKVYEQLLLINQINLNFKKRFSSIRILEAGYTSKNSYFANCFLDANLIFLDSYFDTDFRFLKSKSMMERLLARENSSIINDFSFPKFQARFLIPEGDIANLLLQILFQKDYIEKKNLALKKLHYVFKQKFRSQEMQNFQDILIRLFLRNVALLYTLHRYDEIEYIKNATKYFEDILMIIPSNLRKEFSDIILDENSHFRQIYKLIAASPVEDAFDICTGITRELKK